MKVRSLLAAAALAVGTLFGASQAQAAPVDLALSLVIDVSGSVSTAEYNLQMGGYADAFRDTAIQTNLLNGVNGATAINVVFFGSNFFSTVLDTFTVLTTTAQINTFADALATFVRPGAGGTAIHTGTNRAMDLMLAAIGTGGALEGTTNLVIDVSGDGTGLSSSDQAARTRAQNNNITINGLPIGTQNVANYYTNNVITSDGFIERAATFDDFNAAVRRKIFIETGGGTVSAPSTLALVGLAMFCIGFTVRRRSA